MRHEQLCDGRCCFCAVQAHLHTPFCYHTWFVLAAPLRSKLAPLDARIFHLPSVVFCPAHKYKVTVSISRVVKLLCGWHRLWIWSGLQSSRILGLCALLSNMSRAGGSCSEKLAPLDARIFPLPSVVMADALVGEPPVHQRCVAHK